MTGPMAPQANENLLAEVIRDGPTGIVLSALDDGQILDANETLLRWLGYTREEFVGQTALALDLWVHPARRDAMVATLRKQRHVRDFEAQIRTKSGEIRHFVASMALAERAGRDCALIQIDDLTALRRAEAAMHVAEARFRALVEQIPAVTYTENLGDTGTYLYVSPQVEALFGYSAAEVIHTPNMFAQRVHPDDRDAVQREGERTTATGEPFRMEYRLQARDGRWVLVRDEAVLVRDDDGNPLYWQGVLVDVTEQRQAEDALRQSERRNRAFVVSALDCVIGMDQEGRVTEFNPAAERTFGYCRDDAIGQMLADLIVPPTMREAHRLGLHQLLETGHGPVLGQRFEISAMRADGSVFPVELTITAVSEPDGPWFLGYVRDITSRI
ncbi:MAG: PAS domain S-box protein, partial [Thermomicrobiales bacterium]